MKETILLPEIECESQPRRKEYDAVVVGSGPNGMSAAVTLALHKRSVVVIEAAKTIGGGTRTQELTLPGFLHDHCSAVHPMGMASPLFRSLPLQEFGLEWILPETSCAHVMDQGQVVLAKHSLEDTASLLREDGESYLRLLQPFVQYAQRLYDQTLGPLRLPKHPLLMSRFAWSGLASAQTLCRRHFKTEAAKGLFAGMAAHAILPLDWKPTAAVGLMFGVTAHAGGWPIARGGSQQIANALARYLMSLGGEIVVGRQVDSMSDLPPCRAALFDVSPIHLQRIAGQQLTMRYRRALKRFRYGPGVFKLDWALDGPIPWQATECSSTATVHVGGTFKEVAESERAPWDSIVAEKPFVLVAQQSLFDSTRAPAGKHTGWGYCHVPNGSLEDMTDRIENQIERFAPGFKQRILARHVTRPADFAQVNANFVGGDIAGGRMDLRQILFRPTARLSPYTTSNRNIYVCSASTPPGAGVHGMCGYHAARAALRRARW